MYNTYMFMRIYIIFVNTCLYTHIHKRRAAIAIPTRLQRALYVLHTHTHTHTHTHATHTDIATYTLIHTHPYMLMRIHILFLFFLCIYTHR